MPAISEQTSSGSSVRQAGSPSAVATTTAVSVTSHRIAFHVLGLDKRGVFRRVRVGAHRLGIDRAGITFTIINEGDL